MSFTGSGGQPPEPSASLKRPSHDMDPHSRPSSRVEIPIPRHDPRISVVLGASHHRPAYHTPVAKYDDRAKSPVTSDLPPQLKTQTRVAKQTHVPLPSIPGMNRPLQQEVKRETAVSQPQRPAVQSCASGSSTPTTGRGRPKGWKPGMSYAQMRGNKPPKKAKPGPVGVVKHRGRPPKQPSPPPRVLYHQLDPPFIAFLCEWKGCKAELQNLETLQRHVDIIHLEEQEDEWCCMWGKCGNREPVPEFEGSEELEAHVEEAHLEPFAWHVGDGPVNSSGKRVEKEEEDGIPDYLKDADGNQVTPSILGQQEEDYVTWRDNRRRLKKLLLERERNLQSEGEEEEGEEGDRVV